MSITEFSRDIIPIVLAVIGLFSLISLLLLWWQIKQVSMWNKIQAQRSLVSEEIYNLVRTLHEGAAKAGVDLRDRLTPLADDEVDLIWDEPDSYYPMLKFLNELETVATEVRAGTVDAQFAYSAHFEGVTRNYKIYERVILRFRKTYSNEDLFVEWEKLANEWAVRREGELNEREKRERRAAARETSSRNLIRRRRV